MSRCHFVMTWADQTLEWFHATVLIFFFFFLPPPQPSQSGLESLQFILWMLSIMANRFIPLRNWHLDEAHLPVHLPTSPGEVLFHSMGWANWGLWAPWRFSNWQVGQEEISCLIVIWRPIPLKVLCSNLWRAFSPKWVVACNQLANFHWRFPGRKRSPSFWNYPI